MKCKHVQQKMLDYSEKLLDEKAQAHIEEHLRTCPMCAQELTDIEKTLDLLQSIPVQEPSESFWTDFTSGVMSKISRMETPSPHRGFFYSIRFKMAMAFFVLIAIIGGVYVYFNADIQHILHPVDHTAERSEQSDGSPTLPIYLNTDDDALETALHKIASEDLMQDMLESDLALFDSATGISLDIDYSDDMLYFLIHSLTEEEKKALLSELHKMKSTTQ